MILLLIQIGGLGLVTLILFILLLQRRALKLREGLFLRNVLNVPALGGIGRFLFFTLLLTALFEATGAALIAWAGAPDPHPTWWAVFHSISAFCNAGFSLSAQGLVPYAQEPDVVLIIAALLVAGGLGFPVWHDLLRAGAAKLRAGRARLQLHTRISLSATAFLLLAGTVWILAVEAGGSLWNQSWPNRILNSFFQSATARTAGFNTIEISSLSLPTLIVITGLMAIGASPASTGGGIKTSTAAIVCLTARSLAANRTRVEAFGRSIPSAVVNASVAIGVLYGTAAFAFTTLLLLLEPQLRFIDALFETVSALSTVGLSTGITPRLGAPARLLLCGAMLVGRLGPMSVLWTVLSQPRELRYAYPEEPVLVS